MEGVDTRSISERSREKREERRNGDEQDSANSPGDVHLTLPPSPFAKAAWDEDPARIRSVKFACVLCDVLLSKDDICTLSRCSHQFCGTCFKKYVQEQLGIVAAEGEEQEWGQRKNKKNWRDIECPLEGCGCSLSKEDIKKGIASLSPEIREKFLTESLMSLRYYLLEIEFIILPSLLFQFDYQLFKSWRSLMLLALFLLRRVSTYFHICKHALYSFFSRLICEYSSDIRFCLCNTVSL
jgi:hypothetical protein